MEIVYLTRPCKSSKKMPFSNTHCTKRRNSKYDSMWNNVKQENAIQRWLTKSKQLHRHLDLQKKQNPRKRSQTDVPLLAPNSRTQLHILCTTTQSSTYILQETKQIGKSWTSCITCMPTKQSPSERGYSGFTVVQLSQRQSEPRQFPPSLYTETLKIVHMMQKNPCRLATMI